MLTLVIVCMLGLPQDKIAAKDRLSGKKVDVASVKPKLTEKYDRFTGVAEFWTEPLELFDGAKIRFVRKNTNPDPKFTGKGLDSLYAVIHHNIADWKTDGRMECILPGAIFERDAYAIHHSFDGLLTKETVNGMPNLVIAEIPVPALKGAKHIDVRLGGKEFSIKGDNFNAMIVLAKQCHGWDSVRGERLKEQSKKTSRRK